MSENISLKMGLKLSITFVIIHFSSILHHNMGIKCAEDPFNMGMFFDLRRPS